MGGRAILGESVRMARASMVQSIVYVALAAAIPVSLLAVAGVHVETQAAVMGRVDDAGARLITVVTSGGGAAIPVESIGRLSRLEGVEWVIGLGAVRDVRNASGAGGLAPMREYLGIRAPVRVRDGGSGAMISNASAVRLGLTGGFGALEPGNLTVAGAFSAEYPLQDPNRFVLGVVATGTERRFERAIVSVADTGWVGPVGNAVTAMVGAAAVGQVSIQTNPILIAAKQAVKDEVVGGDRLVVFVVLIGGMAVAAVATSGGVLAARRDLGRRRALGATRSNLAALVVLMVLWPSLAGAAVGTLGGWLLLSSQLGQLADPRFPAAVGILTVGAIVTAAVVPGILASLRDLLAVLRVP